MNPTQEERIERLQRMADEWNVAPPEDATDDERLLVAVGQLDVYAALRLEGE